MTMKRHKEGQYDGNTRQWGVCVWWSTRCGQTSKSCPGLDWINTCHIGNGCWTKIVRRNHHQYRMMNYTIWVNPFGWPNKILFVHLPLTKCVKLVQSGLCALPLLYIVAFQCLRSIQATNVIFRIALSLKPVAEAYYEHRWEPAFNVNRLSSADMELRWLWICLV